MRFSLSADIGDSEWTYDSEEEFFADYRKYSSGAFYNQYCDKSTVEFKLHVIAGLLTIVKISAPDRGKIEAVFDIFERDVDTSRFSPPEKPHPVVFIGHGKDQQWRDLKDHLHEKHDYRVEAYEIGARAGHTIRDVLEDMPSKTSFAVLVMTGEDETSEGDFRARQNVIHEAGLF